MFALILMSPSKENKNVTYVNNDCITMTLVQDLKWHNYVIAFGDLQKNEHL